jgi:hypothetical protein
MELAAIDWFKDTKRMDNVARQKGCVAQVKRKNNLEPSKGLPIGKMTTIAVKSRMARGSLCNPCAHPSKANAYLSLPILPLS